MTCEQAMDEERATHCDRAQKVGTQMMVLHNRRIVDTIRQLSMWYLNKYTIEYNDAYIPHKMEAKYNKCDLNNKWTAQEGRDHISVFCSRALIVSL